MTRHKQAEHPGPQASGVRLNRYLARAGICSRRKADALIQSGEVDVNGRTVTDFSYRVQKDDRVSVDGEPVQTARAVYVLINKPRDTITTVSDDRGRQTVLDLIPETLAELGVFPVGRLDRNTTGVLLLTNDGHLAHRLMHPSFEVEKLYRVWTEKAITVEDVRRLKSGVELEDGLARAVSVSKESGHENVVTVLLHQGRNRQVRRMFGVLGHSISRLDRVEYAGMRYSHVKRGAWRPLTGAEVKALRTLTGAE